MKKLAVACLALACREPANAPLPIDVTITHTAQFAGELVKLHSPAFEHITLVPVSDAAAHQRDEVPRGTGLLPADLTPDQLASAPTMSSVDVLLIDDLTDDEDDAFAAAVHE